MATKVQNITITEMAEEIFFEAANQNNAKIDGGRLRTAAEQMRRLFYRARIETEYRGMRLGIHTATEICADLRDSIKDYTAANAAYVRNTISQILA